MYLFFVLFLVQIYMYVFCCGFFKKKEHRSFLLIKIPSPFFFFFNYCSSREGFFSSSLSIFLGLWFLIWSFLCLFNFFFLLFFLKKNDESRQNSFDLFMNMNRICVLLWINIKKSEMSGGLYTISYSPSSFFFFNGLFIVLSHAEKHILFW
jgi:hypothetical protein